MFAPFLKKKPSSERQSVQELGDQAVSDLIPEEQPVESGNSETGERRSYPSFTNKSHMDKQSLDLVFAVEQMIQAKQNVDDNANELQDRLNYANGNIERLNRELKNLNKVIEDREKSVLDLERKLTEKNLKVDQMMEDYRELQSTLSDQIEELKSMNELERQKYDALLQKSNEMQAEKNKKISDLEEKIGKLEIENAHMKQKFEELRQEKTYLVNIVNDFTARMTSPFSPKPNASDTSSSE
jgi:chromosome segregation ATPase